jgi:hypothetical protein
MSADTAGESGDDVSPAAKIYQSMASDLLAAEFERRKTLEGRGATLLTASASLVTLIFGLTVVVTGKDHVFANHTAVILLCLALVPFVLSALIALAVQTYGFKYQVIDRKSLDKLAETHEFWVRSADYAVRDDVSQQVKTISTLRGGNDTMAALVLVSLAFEVLATILLSISVGLELYTRL